MNLGYFDILKMKSSVVSRSCIPANRSVGIIFDVLLISCCSVIYCLVLVPLTNRSCGRFYTFKLKDIKSLITFCRHIDIFSNPSWIKNLDICSFICLSGSPMIIGKDLQCSEMLTSSSFVSIFIDLINLCWKYSHLPCPTFSVFRGLIVFFVQQTYHLHPCGG